MKLGRLTLLGSRNTDAALRMNKLGHFLHLSTFDLGFATLFRAPSKSPRRTRNASASLVVLKSSRLDLVVVMIVAHRVFPVPQLMRDLRPASASTKAFGGRSKLTRPSSAVSETNA